MKDSTIFSTQRFSLLSGALVLTALGSVACDSDKSGEEKEQQEVAAEPATESAGDASTPSEEGSDSVQVAASGTRFDPPVAKEKIPMGAWMCDMDKVHYAAMEKGDGECPVCGMKLTHHMKKGERMDHGEEGHMEHEKGEHMDHEGDAHDGH